MQFPNVINQSGYNGSFYNQFSNALPVQLNQTLKAGSDSATQSHNTYVQNNLTLRHGSTSSFDAFGGVSRFSIDAQEGHNTFSFLNAGGFSSAQEFFKGGTKASTLTHHAVDADSHSTFENATTQESVINGSLKTGGQTMWLGNHANGEIFVDHSSAWDHNALWMDDGANVGFSAGGYVNTSAMVKNGSHLNYTGFDSNLNRLNMTAANASVTTKLFG